MARVKCPRCEFVNPEGAEACAQCSTPLPRVIIEAKPRPASSQPAAAGQAEAMGPFFFHPGQLVAARYSVLDVIGRGGMGCIYRVHDNVLKEEVALKTLLPQFVRDKMVVERFFNEARIARSLSHPNIVRVHDIGMTNNIIYISMELIKGKSLRNMTDELPPGQRLPTKTILRIIDELCAALEYAHRHTVHRDIKPENIMVCSDATVKLMDFGISKLMDRSGLTGTSIVMGTPFYMSPEQLRNSASVDARADIYSVGVVLYEILTGNVPTGVPKPASQLTREVPPALDPIVAKCVDPDPNKRYQSASDLRAALRPIIELLDSGSIIAAPIEQKPPAWNARAFARKAAAVALMLLIVGLTGSALYAMEKGRAEQLAKSAKARAAPRSGEPGGPAPTQEFEIAYRKLAERVATQRSNVSPDARSNEDMARVLEYAKARWDLAEAEAKLKNPKALALAREAVQCYMALHEWESGMVFIPPGSVAIGDDKTSNVIAVDGFFIDVYEVTNGQYLDFCNQAGWRLPSYNLQDVPPNMPVVDVTFYDAQAYAAWAKKRLPTEVQWARAAYGDPTASDRYPWGAEWQPGACNCGTGEGPDAYAAPVGTFPKDRTWSGCCDMAGNVSEWTQTAFAELPYNPLDGRDNPALLTFGSLVSVRGGNYRDAARTTLSARVSSLFEAHDYALGFRCVKELPKEEEDAGAARSSAQ